jgi:hypothetical protein
MVALLAIVSLGCQSRQAQPATPKAGVVYLDPNAAPKATAAPAAEPQRQATAAPDPVRTGAPEPQATEVPEEPEAPLDLYFELRGVRLEPMMEAAPVLAALGEPIRRFEADSCAYVGKDVFYAYPGVQLTVNNVEGVERITLITVADDTVTIPQGLRIYDEEDRLLDLLGGDEDDGLYTYRSGQVELVIQVKEAGDGIRRIAYIEYRVAEDQ